ncbi:MAG: PRD domain-containing protein [Culicoidibacterales bacterium]
MRIIRIFNNNAIVAVNKQHIETILLGSGIAYGKKVGDTVVETAIEKRYHLSDGDATIANKVFESIPYQYYQIASTILDYAEEKMHQKLRKEAIIILADHINFSIKRHHDNVELPNLMLREIQVLYDTPYGIGIWGIKHINEILDITLTEDEAGFIAMHIINATINAPTPIIHQYEELIENVLKLIEEQLSLELDRSILIYSRLETHLKYLIRKVVSTDKNQKKNNKYQQLYTNLIALNLDLEPIIQGVAFYIESQYAYELDLSDKLYLAIHLERIITERRGM